MHRGKTIDRTGDYRVMECAGCGFVHIDPLPTTEDLAEVYREDYYTTEKPLYLERSNEDASWWESVHDERLDAFETRLDPARRKVLDIGCGPGFFLKRASDRGWSALGIEPSVRAAEHARGLGVRVLDGFFDAESARKIVTEFGTFDAVHLSEVLEHVPDPAAILRLVRSVLSPGGVVCCVVPNDYNPVQEVLRKDLEYKPYWLAPPHHINYFTFESLGGLLERTGLRTVDTTAMFPMDLFLLMGDNYVGDDAKGRECHARRKKLELALENSHLKEFKRDLYRTMARHGVGREVVIFAEKGEAE